VRDGPRRHGDRVPPAPTRTAVRWPMLSAPRLRRGDRGPVALPFLLPLKLLVVFIHETWHALAALATGGSVDEIVVRRDQSGLATFRGGWYTVIASAGYVGSSLTGALLLWAGARRARRAVTGALGRCSCDDPALRPLRNRRLRLRATRRRPAARRRPQAAARAQPGRPGSGGDVLPVLGLRLRDYLVGDPQPTDAGLLAATSGWLGSPGPSGSDGACCRCGSCGGAAGCLHPAAAAGAAPRGAIG